MRLDPDALERASRNLPALAGAMVSCGQIDAQQARAALAALTG